MFDGDQTELTRPDRARHGQTGQERTTEQSTARGPWTMATDGGEGRLVCLHVLVQSGVRAPLDKERERDWPGF